MSAGQTPGDAGRINANTKVNDVLRRHPRIGEVFIQHGPLGLSEPGKLYIRYQDETVAEYAERNRADLKALLDVLNAEAEAAPSATPVAARLKRRPTARGSPPDGPIGYTSAYRDVTDCGIETESVVASQLARGPD